MILKNLPNFLSVLGLFFSVGCGYQLASGTPRAAFAFFALACLCDFLDGKLARATGTQTTFGACLDSFLDRYADGALIAGAAWKLAADRWMPWIAVGFSAMISGYAVSYVRARSEGLGIPNRAGFWERPERLLVFGTAILCDRLGNALLILAVLPHATALRRLCVVWLESRAADRERGSARPHWINREKNRKSFVYLAQIVFWMISSSSLVPSIASWMSSNFT